MSELEHISGRLSDIFRILEKQGEDITAIKIQTAEINGRVSRLEEIQAKCPIHALDTLIALEKDPAAKKRNAIGTAVLFFASGAACFATCLGIYTFFIK
jgi:hypothetical protein